MRVRDKDEYRADLNIAHVMLIYEQKDERINYSLINVMTTDHDASLTQ
jgi:hypothetical protein